MYGRILVPLDGSPLAEAVLDYVALIPSRSVRLLHVAARGERVGAGGSPRDYLERSGARFEAAGRAVEPAVVSGDPAERIVEAAAEADLIAMTTRGRGAGGRLIYGSVADRVARHAPVPTLVVRTGHDPIANAPVGRIVVPLDGSEVATRAVSVAARLCDAVGCSMLLVAVAETGEAPTVGAPVPSAVDETVRAATDRAARHLERVAAGLAAATATTEVRTGQPAAELLATIRPGDLVVMTTHGGGGGQRWHIGGVAEKLLHRAPAPVLLVRGDRAPAV